MHEGELNWRPPFDYLPDIPHRPQDDNGASWAWLREHCGALGLNAMPFATATAFGAALAGQGMKPDEAMARALALETTAHVARELPVEFAHALLVVAPKRYRRAEHPQLSFDSMDAPFNAFALPGLLGIGCAAFSHALHDAALVGIWGVKSVDGPHGEHVDISEDVWRKLNAVPGMRDAFIEADPDEPEF
jgi:hypothetical protein